MLRLLRLWRQRTGVGGPTSRSVTLQATRPGLGDRPMARSSSGPRGRVWRTDQSIGHAPAVQGEEAPGSGDRPRRGPHSGRVLSFCCFLLTFMPTCLAFSQPASQKPDPAEIQRQREHINRALHDAQSLLQEGALADHLESAAGALSHPYTPGRGFDFSLPDSLSQGYPFIDEHVGHTVVPQQAPRLSSHDDRIRPLILISFGMPDSQIRGLLEEAHRLKAAVVIRGLINDDWGQTFAAIHRLSDDGLSGISIDPTVFARFGVSRVPTFVLPLERLEPCTQDGCRPVKHVRATGSASLSYFLHFVARVGQPEERHKARNWLARHKGEKP